MAQIRKTNTKKPRLYLRSVCQELFYNLFLVHDLLLCLLVNVLDRYQIPITLGIIYRPNIKVTKKIKFVNMRHKTIKSLWALVAIVGIIAMIFFTIMPAFY